MRYDWILDETLLTRSSHGRLNLPESVNQEIAIEDYFHCKNCQKMPSLPQGAFATFKVRAHLDEKSNDKYKVVDRVRSGFPDPKLIDFEKNKALSPLKYNEKLMNSIWGHYNRYSPHNIKSNDANEIVGKHFAASNHN